MLKLQTISNFFLLLSLFFCSSCYKVEDKIEPEVNYCVQDKYIKELSSPFPPLSTEEKETAWGKEYRMGKRFAQTLDLYRAITAFKRAEFLLPLEEGKRLQEISYQIMLSYYLGKRYAEAIHTFDDSPLYSVSPSFPAYHDLLIILYESYLEIGQVEQAKQVLLLFYRYYPETAEKLQISTALLEGNLSSLESAKSHQLASSYICPILEEYHRKKKSIPKAQTLNAIIPGSGYLYVGQKQSALTAFLLNGLFITAAIHFFVNGHTAAGIITTSFEAGWYFGGIYGAGESAKLYNERLYESYTYPTMNYHGLFPVLMLKYGF